MTAWCAATQSRDRARQTPRLSRVGDGLAASDKALAMTVDVTPRYCLADPHEGGKQAVAEAWRNLVAVGARPLAVTDNLNFGNPTRPEIMGQLVGCVEGIAEACRALDFPVVSGNVSLYNETDGESIPPTPTVGGVGVIADVNKAVGIALRNEGDQLFVVGAVEGGHLGQSLYLREVLGWHKMLDDSPVHYGSVPPVDLAKERRHGEFILKLIDLGLLSACHDISDGGLLVAVAEMALAGNLGAHLHAWGIPDLFGEDQARYVVATGHLDQVIALAAEHGVTLSQVGACGGSILSVMEIEISLDELRAAHESWLPGYMNG